MQSRRAGLRFIVITIFIDVLGFGIIIPIFPDLVKQLSHSSFAGASRAYGVILAVYGLMQFVFSPLFGSLSDSVGRRPVLLLSLFATGIDYIIMSVAPSLVWLFIGRAISGITGASITTASAYIADVSSPEKRAQSFGLIGAAFGLGFMIGPGLGGVLGHLGPRAPFVGAAALSLVNWLYGAFVLPESLARRERRRFNWRRANPVGSLGLLTRHRLVRGLTVSFVFLNLAQQALQSTWVLSNSFRFHWGPLENGVSLMVVGAMSVVVQTGLMRRLMPVLGERRVFIYSLFIGAISYTLFGLSTRGWMMYAAIVVNGLGFLAGPAGQGLISRPYPSNEQGAVQGALTSLNSLVGVIGPVFATSLWGYFVGSSAPVKIPGAAFFYAAVMTLLAIAVSSWEFRRSPTEPSVTRSDETVPVATVQMGFGSEIHPPSPSLLPEAPQGLPS